MNLRDSQTQSPWQEASQPLTGMIDPTQDQIFDVLIVGAGITGLSTALLLQEAGQKCIVVEAGNVGFGTTGGTSAHLNTFFDATYPEIARDFGTDAARLVADSGQEALAMIRSLISKYEIDCDFEWKDGYLFSANKEETTQLQKIYEASEAAGVAVSWSETNELTVPFESAVCFHQQGQFHPMKYVQALASAFTALGGLILEQTFVTAHRQENGLNLTVAGNKTFKSVNLVHATHIPPGINSFSFRCAPYRSYVLAARLKTANYPKGLVYDMQEPYHYFRTHELNGQTYLIVGGEDHKTGHEDPAQAFANLESYVRQYYELEEIGYKWSSQYYVPADGLPYIGYLDRNEHSFVATGFNGNGMIFGTLSAMLIHDLILDKNNIYAALYNPSRIKPVAGFSDFIKENADVAYHFIADRFSAADLESVADLEKGTGRIAELGGHRVAIYKSEEGLVTALHPVCTHAGCIVNFNAAEQSWDCPCHGGRFDVSGKVITGPPRKDLESIPIRQLEN